jgi:hypothetical protein
MAMAAVAGTVTVAAVVVAVVVAAVVSMGVEGGVVVPRATEAPAVGVEMGTATVVEVVTMKVVLSVV